MILARHPHRLASLAVAAPGGAIGGLAAVSFGGWTAAARITFMMVASLGAMILSAEGLDRRWPASGIGTAFMRLSPIVVGGGLAMLVFADPWVFSPVSGAAVFYGALLVAGLATAAWFRYRSPLTPTSPTQPSQPPARFPMAATQLHLMTAVAISVVLLPVGFLAGALAAYGSGDGSSFYIIFISTLMVIGSLLLISVRFDRTTTPQGAAAAAGRVVAVAVAMLFVVFAVTVILDSALS